MKIETYNIKGMHCASCASIIEKTVKKIDGVENISVNNGTENAKISFDDSKISLDQFNQKLKPLGYSLVISKKKKEKFTELKDMKTKLISAIPLAIISIFIMSWDILAQYNIVPNMNFTTKEFFHYLLPLMAAYTIFVIGKPYLLGLYRFIRYGKANMDTLIGIGTSVAFLYSLIVSVFGESLSKYININNTYFDVTIIVIVFITLGKYLEARSKIKTGDAIEKLLNLQAKTALVLREGKNIEIPIDQVMHGDLITVKPGGNIPVDGVVVNGESFVDESMISGEPMPIPKNINNLVIAGTINTTGSFTFKATKVGSETMLAHIIKMVEEAQGSKAPIQTLADRISSFFVPVVLIISLITLGLWLLIGPQYLGFSQALSFGLVSFVSVLVIACPCALGLATPTAIIVGVGKGAQEGILIKDASTLENLGKVNMVVVDKTGTLTHGKPEFVSIQNFSNKKDGEVISILASLENNSEHPIASAIVSYANKNEINFLELNRFNSIKGKGIEGNIDGVTYYAGSIKLIQELGLSFNAELIRSETMEGKTPIFLSTREKIIGLVMVADAIKPEAVEAVKDLHKLGIKIVMLTGDNKNTANYIAKLIGIDEVVAEVLPGDKLEKIRELQQQGKIVAMAGDGINDAPALAQADVGVAMATGTDVAIESAGITLLHGDISKLVKAVHLSKITIRGIKQNLFWAFVYNSIGIPLAGGLFYPVFGWLLNPVFAGLAMALSSVSVVGNSLRLKTKKL